MSRTSDRSDARRHHGTNIGVTWLIVVALVAVGFAMQPAATEVGVHASALLREPAQGPATAVVAGRHRSGGFSLFGLTFGHATHTLSVQFSAPTGCADVVAVGDSWPTPFDQCANTVPIAGTVSGGGVTAAGESIVVVDVTVGEDCYQATTRGDPWPPAHVSSGCRSYVRNN